jgi:CRP/FNR family transcriptional regulator, cyclic AMP receptor protein
VAEPPTNRQDSPNLELNVPITASEMLALQGIGSVIRRKPGDMLMGEGEETDFVLFIIKGHVKVVLGKPSRIVGIRKAGDLIGEMAAIRKKPRTASIFALDQVEALYLPASKWLQFLVVNPRAALAQLYAAEERLAEATRQTAESLLSAEQRLAKAIIRLRESGIGIDSPDGMVLSFGQQDLADIAGISIDSVKQVIRSFKTASIVSTGRQKTIVRKLDELRAIADGDSTASP